MRLLEEADSIKKMEDKMMERINDQIEIKRKEMVEENRRLRNWEY